MALWAIIIAALSLLLVLNNIFSWGAVTQTMLSYVVLLVSLGILHRVWGKTKAGKREILEDRIAECKKEKETILRELEGLQRKLADK